MRLFLVLFLLSLVLGSCRQDAAEKQLNAVDSLYSILIRADSTLRNLDKNEINEISKKIETNVKQFKSHYGDTIPWETAKLISKYHRLKKALIKHMENNHYITKELGYCREQLENLRNDIENKIMDPDKFQLYYNIEAQTLFILDSLVDHEIEFASNQLDRFKEWDPAIEDLLSKLKPDSVNATTK
jgi:RNA binding exosome subunit